MILVLLYSYNDKYAIAPSLTSSPIVDGTYYLLDLSFLETNYSNQLIIRYY